MPIYEYVCEDCGRIKSVIVFPHEEVEVSCDFCGSKRMKRIISRVRVRCSEDTRIEKAADPHFWSGIDESDPKSLSKAVDRISSLVGDGLDEDFSSIKEDVEASLEEASSEGEGDEEDQE